MKLLLARHTFTTASTIGSISICDFAGNASYECDVLEDVDRERVIDQDTGACTIVPLTPDAKIFGETAIPRGTYDIVVTYSPHFGHDLPLLQGVPNYEGVRIHPGNTAADTEGCLLPGTASVNPDFVGNSVHCWTELATKITNAIAAGESVSITIQ